MVILLLDGSFEGGEFHVLVLVGLGEVADHTVLLVKERRNDAKAASSATPERDDGDILLSCCGVLLLNGGASLQAYA